MPAAAVNSATTPPPKRLLFDRRYGWVLDEWQEPSKEALSGARGMFCIVPLAKGMLEKASESMNFVASSTRDVLEKPGTRSPKAVRAAVNDQLHKFAAAVNNTGLVLMEAGRNIKRHSTSCSEEHSGLQSE